jgi:hypothetical protein
MTIARIHRLPLGSLDALVLHDVIIFAPAGSASHDTAAGTAEGDGRRNRRVLIPSTTPDRCRSMVSGGVVERISTGRSPWIAQMREERSDACARCESADL